MRILLVLLFLIFPMQGCFSENQQKKTEQLKVEDPYSWDFGQVKEGELLKHNFKLKNESKKVLNIKDVNTSCGCTVPKIEKKRLLPGQTTLIEVQFNTKGYSGLTQQYIYVHTDNLDASTPLSVNGEYNRTIDASTPLGINGEYNRTIDNQILRYIIKAEVVK